MKRRTFVKTLATVLALPWLPLPSKAVAAPIPPLIPKLIGPIKYYAMTIKLDDIGKTKTGAVTDCG